jgi:hypothetical protein
MAVVTQECSFPDMDGHNRHAGPSRKREHPLAPWLIDRHLAVEAPRDGASREHNQHPSACNPSPGVAQSGQPLGRERRVQIQRNGRFAHLGDSRQPLIAEHPHVGANLPNGGQNREAIQRSRGMVGGDDDGAIARQPIQAVHLDADVQRAERPGHEVAGWQRLVVPLQGAEPEQGIDRAAAAKRERNCMRANVSAHRALPASEAS